MSAELALGEVALGAVLGIVGTVVGVYATHHFEERREDRKTRNEEWKLVVDEVYSPMFFDLMKIRKGILVTLGAIRETLPESSNKFTQEDIVASLTIIAQINSRYKQSQMLEDMLRKKSRVIKPSDLWIDLYLFCDYIQEIEDNFSIIAMGRFKRNPEQLLSVVQSCVLMGETLEEAASYIRVEIGKLVVSMTDVPKSVSYKRFFTDDIVAKMEKQHESILKALATPSRAREFPSL